MESSEQKGGFGTIVLVLLLVLAFIVGTALFAFVGYQFLSGGQRDTAKSQQLTATALAMAPTATPTATVAPTSTPVPTVQPPATAVPTAAPAVEATATRAPTARPQAGSHDNLPQTGVGPVASAASVLLAGAALGSRWLRRRS